MQLLKLIRLIPLLLGILFAIWLGTNSARAAIPAALGDIEPERVMIQIQQWGQLLSVGFGALATLVLASLPLIYSIKKKAADLEAEFKAEQEKRKQIEAVQAVHHEDISQINAVAQTPVATIPAPANPPLIASQPLKP